MSAIVSAKQPASDKGGHVAIPFFDSLPLVAIPASQRLYDEVSAPGCNALTAYANFVSRLNNARMDPPPRAVVKRWVAGVQAGLIERPALPDAAPVVVVQQQSYFEALPEAAMPALTQLWDEVQASTLSNDEEAEDEHTFDNFFEAMRAIGHREPEWKLFVAYARAIRAGQVERPARQIDEEALSASVDKVEDAPQWQPAPEKANAERMHRASKIKPYEPFAKPVIERKVLDVLAQHPHMIVPAQPETTVTMDEVTRLVTDVTVSMPDAPTFEAARQKILDALASAPSIPTLVTPSPEFQPAPAVVAVQAAAGRLLEENIIQLSREIEHTARQNTARMLRAMADELEGSAAHQESSLRSSIAG